MNRPRRWPAVALAMVPGLAFQAWFVVRWGYSTAAGLQFTLVDDAMISMTYGRTLAETGELVWFPGAPRVQGFTNLLWTLYMALLHVIGLAGSGAALAVTLTNLCFLVATALFTYRLVDRLAGGASRLPALVACGTVPLLFPLIYWSLRGMETGLIALVVVTSASLSYALLERWVDGRPAAPTCAALGLAGSVGVLTRLDVAVLVAVPLALLVVWAPTASRRVEVVLFGMLPVVAVSGGVVAFQALYYSDWLPNTYRLKMEGFPVLDRVARGAAAAGKVLPLLCFAAWGFAGARTSPDAAARRLASLLLGMVLAAAGYSVWVGGDAWEEFLFCNRYVSVVLPLMVALAVLGVEATVGRRALSQGRRLLVVGSATASGLAMGVLTNPVSYLPPIGLAEGVVMGLGAIAVLDRLSGPGAIRGRALLLAAGTFAAVAGLVGMVVVTRVGGDTDVELETRIGQLLNRGTAADARIAVTSAGTTAYYARRPMVDLLGKNDRRIATGPPAVIDPADPVLERFRTFYPGHNKWNYDYSIGELRPDVVLPLFHVETIPQLEGWGYERRCLDGFPVFVLGSSTKIDRTVFAVCPE